MSAEACEFLFVYGTLRRDCGGPVDLRRELEQGAVECGLASMPGQLVLIENDFGRYPGLVGAGDDVDARVVGELYRMRDPDRLLPKLDAYEECSPSCPQPHEYRREISLVETAAGERVRAWVYWYQGSTPNLAMIEPGDFLSLLSSG